MTHPAAGIGRPRPDSRHRHWTVGAIVLADGSRLLVTTHCVDRFWERVAMGCPSFRAARERLVVLAREIGEPVAQPAWARTIDADTFVAIGPDACLVVAQNRAVTCVTRGGMSDGQRQHRNRVRRGRRRTGR